ncbi:U3 small nucleolar RNA-associated protein 4 homolog [Uranotaenia lowii]|uniref:U3 small nucleolar RNA-associated protein 4 homolog n=1 Tax=Uranotaenia lowii TaxID=190385 RepID=UPI00247962C0|nr:U3 small nucleolar RNA-associated protein 4 homolog [Uranotaenia lowii]
MVTKTQPGQCKLHHVQFYNLLPREISVLAVNSSSGKLALARDDGTIEIWSLAAAPFLEKSIPGGGEVSVEGLAWVKDRLFSVGLSGSLVEWDLKKHSVKSSVLVTGNAAWCMDVSKNNQLLAVGTEGGYINIYNVQDDSINYEKILDKQEGRIVCLKFDYSGDFIVTGSADAVRVWNVKKGHAVHKMTTGRTQRDKETIVWNLLVLKDFTIVSGDSRGKIMFFDGHLGTSFDSIPASKSDVLCLAINDKEDMLFVGGVEPNIKIYQRVEVSKGGEKIKSFVRSLTRKCHTHDVKAMTMFDQKLISGGTEGTLAISSFPPLVVDKYMPYLMTPSAVIAENARMILLKYVNYLEVWTLSSGHSESVKILQIRSKLDEHILAASISSDGKHIIYSSEATIRLYRFEYQPEGQTNQTRLVPIRTVPEQFEAPCSRVEFCHDSKGVLLFKLNGQIEYFTFNQEGDFDHKQSIETGKWFTDRIHLVTLSHDDAYLACGSLCGAIVVLKKEKFGKWKRLTSLPRYKLPPTAIAIQPNSPILAAVFPDQKIFQYDFSEYRFTFTSFLQLNRMDASLNQPITGILFDPRNDEIMILQHDTTLLVSQLEDSEAQDGQKRKKLNTSRKSVDDEEADDAPAPSHRYSLKILKSYPRLVSSSWLGNDEMVVVEANPVSMVEYLPPAYRKKVFGAA